MLLRRGESFGSTDSGVDDSRFGWTRPEKRPTPTCQALLRDSRADDFGVSCIWNSFDSAFADVADRQHLSSGRYGHLRDSFRFQVRFRQNRTNPGAEFLEEGRRIAVMGLTSVRNTYTRRAYGVSAYG